MLTLGLKIGDYITIGDDIKIYIVDQKSSNIYLGVDAPREKRILREKLHESLIENGRLVLKNGEVLLKDGERIKAFSSKEQAG